MYKYTDIYKRGWGEFGVSVLNPLVKMDSSGAVAELWCFELCADAGVGALAFCKLSCRCGDTFHPPENGLYIWADL